MQRVFYLDSSTSTYREDHYALLATDILEKEEFVYVESFPSEAPYFYPDSGAYREELYTWLVTDIGRKDCFLYVDSFLAEKPYFAG